MGNTFVIDFLCSCRCCSACDNTIEGFEHVASNVPAALSDMALKVTSHCTVFSQYSTCSSQCKLVSFTIHGLVIWYSLAFNLHDHHNMQVVQ